MTKTTHSKSKQNNGRNGRKNQQVARDINEARSDRLLGSEQQNIDLQNNIGFLVSDAHRLVTQVVDTVMSDLGLTRSQLRLLLFLMRKDGYTQVELAESLEIGKMGMGGLVTRLEEKGLLVRKSHPEDGRAKRVYLTKKVKTLYGPMLDLGDGLMDKLLAGLSNEEQQQFIYFLKVLKNNCKDILDEET